MEQPPRYNIKGMTAMHTITKILVAALLGGLSLMLVACGGGSSSNASVSGVTTAAKLSVVTAQQ